MRRGYRALFFALALCGCGEREPANEFSPQRMADALHAVLSANREAYARTVVDRLQYQEGRMKATEHYREEKALPLPAQMLRMSAEAIAKEGQPFSYALLSPWPINKQNGPRTDSEKNGLRAVTETGQPHYTEEVIDGKRYFAAYYPDKAVIQACARCHNEHEDSPRKDFRTGDVLGGLVIRIWLSKG